MMTVVSEKKREMCVECMAEKRQSDRERREAESLRDDGKGGRRCC